MYASRSLQTKKQLRALQKGSKNEINIYEENI